MQAIDKSWVSGNVICQAFNLALVLVETIQMTACLVSQIHSKQPTVYTDQPDIAERIQSTITYSTHSHA